MKATWNGQTIAQSDDTVVVEGNHYFPIDSLNSSLTEPSEYTSYCPWKGTASYFHLAVDGTRNENAAWTYREPKEAANDIDGRVAFWNGVEVSE